MAASAMGQVVWSERVRERLGLGRRKSLREARSKLVTAL
jgi:hypothetical protein